MSLTETTTEGFVLKLSDMASSATFTEIEGLTAPDGPTRTREILEARHHSSTAIIKKTGKLDPGQMTFQLYFDSTNTQHLALQTGFGNATALDFQAVFSDTGAQQLAFTAYVSQFKQSAPVDGFNMMDVTLTLSGDVTIT